ncbi:MotA/TolQ/ExbB proton channel family protein [bacterium]|nr:MotA/TolQ/ExbB proton channel family protein [bacterium]
MTSILEMLDKGGIMIYPLLLTSVTGLTVAIERAIFLRRKRIIRPDVLSLIRNITSLDEVARALQGLSGKKGPFINIIQTGLAAKGRPRQEIKEAIVDRGRQEARSLERGLAVLETVAGISPLMGLMGTVLGMIKVFRVISEQGLGQTQSLSAGISEALLTTVVGLAIAIPALVAFNYFTHKVEDLVLEIEEHSSYLLDKVSGIREQQ